MKSLTTIATTRVHIHFACALIVFNTTDENRGRPGCTGTSQRNVKVLDILKQKEKRLAREHRAIARTVKTPECKQRGWSDSDNKTKKIKLGNHLSRESRGWLDKE